MPFHHTPLLDLQMIQLLLICVIVMMEAIRSTSSSEQPNAQGIGLSYLNLSAHPEVYGIGSTNCSAHLPQNVFRAIERYSKSQHQHAPQQSRNISLIPDDFLVECLLNVSYMPFWRALGYSDRLRLQLAFALEQLLELELDGTLTLKATLEMRWNEPHLQWNIAAVPLSIAAQCATTASFILQYPYFLHIFSNIFPV